MLSLNNLDGCYCLASSGWRLPALKLLLSVHEVPCPSIICSCPQIFLLALAAAPLTAQAASEVTTPSGLRIIDVKPGSGPVPQAGQTVTVNYAGWLYVDGKKGKKFDSSLDRGEPFSFTLGQGQVIKGWDEGVATMHVGGQRTLIHSA